LGKSNVKPFFRKKKLIFPQALLVVFSGRISSEIKFLSRVKRGRNKKLFRPETISSSRQNFLDLNQKRFKRGKANSLFENFKRPLKFFRHRSFCREPKKFFSSLGKFSNVILWIRVDML